MQSKLADQLRGKKRFLYAKNVYDEARPGLGAVAFTVDSPNTTTNAICTVLIEGSDWFTHLSFYADQGTMWVYPNEYTGEVLDADPPVDRAKM